MDIQQIGLPILVGLKLLIYFALLLGGARLLRTPERPGPTPLRLALVALGRVAIGIPVGPVVFLGVSAATGANPAAGLVALPVAGFFLWIAAARLAFGDATDRQRVKFALAAEVVSVGLDYFIMMQFQGKMC